MDNKVLTISIAAYNVQDYITQALKSIVDSERLQELEVFVIDDGGNDKTADIAKEYEYRFPDTFKMVRKANGGYGSTVNWSVTHATGKYFKLLDGDDWFNSKSLSDMIDRMKVSDSDAFISDTIKTDGTGWEKKCYPFCKDLDGRVLSIFEAAALPIVAMWACAFKTSIVKDYHRNLPEHCMYTDTIYMVQTLTGVKSLEYFGEPVYYYRVGRQGQSNSVASIEKHFDEAVEVCERLFLYYEQLPVNQKNKYMLKRIMATYNSNIQMLCKLKHTKQNLKILRDYERHTKENHPLIYNSNKAKRLSLLRKTHYLTYWINFPD